MDFRPLATVVAPCLLAVFAACSNDDPSGPTVDGGVDGGVDASADGAPSDGGDGGSCTRGSPSVHCAGKTCEGATPVCCEKGGEVRCAAGSCPSFSDSDPTPHGVNELKCDDAADCPEGEVCCASYDKGLSRSMATCRDATSGCSAVCFQDCDCPAGKRCRVGVCD